MSYKIRCPLMGEDIDDAICFDIHCVVDNGAPEWTAPKKATQTKDFKSICKSCEHHQDD